MKLFAAIVAGAIAVSICDVRFSNAAPATTQATTQPARGMRQAFLDLASSDARTREDARVELMGLTKSDLPALQDLVKQSAPLAPAQVAALHEIVSHIYLAAENDPGPDELGGFLGLLNIDDFSAFRKGQGSLDGVLVQTRVPGFCGYRFLQEGDLIQKIIDPVEMPLTRFMDLRNCVSFMRPGNLITLEVLRNGQSRSVTIPLDARPRALPVIGGFDDYVNHRNAQAEEYWKKTFAPLVEKSLF